MELEATPPVRLALPQGRRRMALTRLQPPLRSAHSRQHRFKANALSATLLRRPVRTQDLHRRRARFLQLMGPAPQPDEAPSPASVPLRTHKADSPPGGKGAKIIWDEHTTWTTTQDRQHGSALQQTTMLASSARNWNNRPISSVPDIRTACFLKIVQEQILPRCPTERMLRHQRTHQWLRLRPTMRVQPRWWQPVLPPPALESCQPAGSSAIHPKDERTL